VGLGLLIFEVSQSHSDITLGRAPLDAWSARRQKLNMTTYNTHNREASMFLAAFEHATPASEWPQTHTLNRTATGNSLWRHRSTKMSRRNHYLSCKPKLQRQEPVELGQCNKELIQGTGWIILLSTDSRPAPRTSSPLPKGCLSPFPRSTDPRTWSWGFFSGYSRGLVYMALLVRCTAQYFGALEWKFNCQCLCSVDSATMARFVWVLYPKGDGGLGT